MAYLTVGGTDIPVATETPPSLDETEIGSRADADDGTHSAAILGWKRTWNVTTIPMLRSAADALQTLLAGAPPLTATGTWLGGASVSVVPTLPVWAPVNGPTIRYRLAFTLDEV